MSQFFNSNFIIFSLLDLVVVVALLNDNFLRVEGVDLDSGSLFSGFLLVLDGFKSEDVGEEVSSGEDELSVGLVIGVVVKDLGESLQTTPEELSRFGLVVRGEGVEKLGNHVVESVLEHFSGKGDASVVAGIFEVVGDLVDGFKLRD
mgnify:CR=1 FL=1